MSGLTASSNIGVALVIDLISIVPVDSAILIVTVVAMVLHV